MIRHKQTRGATKPARLTASKRKGEAAVQKKGRRNTHGTQEAQRPWPGMPDQSRAQQQGLGRAPASHRDLLRGAEGNGNLQQTAKEQEVSTRYGPRATGSAAAAVHPINTKRSEDTAESKGHNP